MTRLLVRLVLLAGLVGAAFHTLPQGWRGLELRIASEDPATLADFQLRGRFDATFATAQIEEALQAGDTELATSFVALANDRGVALSPDLLARVEAANSAGAQTARGIYNFAHGFVTGEPNDFAGLAGATTGDLMVYGDIRDLTRESTRWLRGEAVDPLIAGLAAAGLAVTAGTYFTLGTAAPVRIGSSILKVARRTGRMSARFADDAIGLLKARRTDRVAGALADLGKVQQKAGTRAALEGLRHAETVADVAKAGRLAEKKGKSTLAIFKTLGRGAIAVGAGLLAVSGWVVGAAVNLIFLAIALVSFCVAVLRWLWPGRLTQRQPSLWRMLFRTGRQPSHEPLRVAESAARG
jgi:hypothetical protein